MCTPLIADLDGGRAVTGRSVHSTMLGVRVHGPVTSLDCANAEFAARHRAALITTIRMEACFPRGAL